MVKRNFNGVQINQSVTIVEKAGADVADVRNCIMKYDENGDVVVATDGTAALLGIALIEAGYNDITGKESGKVVKGDDVDIQIKDMGVVVAGESIKKGQEITAGAEGLAAVAASGDFVLGTALTSAEAGGFVRVLIAKYVKGAGAASSEPAEETEESTEPTE